MTPSPELIEARRAALISRTDAAGTPGLLLLRDAANATLLAIPLALPCGLVDTTGVALTLTEYAQVTTSGAVANARLEDGNGVWVGDFSAGLATDVPAPELVLPIANIYAGSFVRLNGAHIACD